MNPTRLILGCRTKVKAETAAKGENFSALMNYDKVPVQLPSFILEIQQSASSETTVEPWGIDLGDFKPVSNFANRYETEGNGRLDLLVMNAGINTGICSKDETGWEKSIKVNHLDTSLLTLPLLPYIKKAPFSPPTPRIVILGSEVHYLTAFENQAKKSNILEALNEEETSRGFVIDIFKRNVNKFHIARARTLTGLQFVTVLNLFFTRALATRLPPPSPENHNPIVTNVNARAREPWMVQYSIEPRSKLSNEGIFKYLMGRSAEEGSRTIVWAALAHLDSTLHGRYTTSCRIDEESDYSLSPEGKETERRIWVWSPVVKSS